MNHSINAAARLESILEEPVLAKVPLSLARGYVRLYNPALYNNLFQKYGSGHGTQKYRIYIPLGGKPTTDNLVPPPELVAYLATKKMSVNDYKTGTALLPDGKRIVRIGKVVADNPTVKKIFEQDPQRTATKSVAAWVCISRHPYDIAGMSFDRGWTSCMHITEGCNKQYLTADVKMGTLVAYLIKENDKNINAPIARIALKPYTNKQGRILVPSQPYGMGTASFVNIVNQFCQWANSGSPTGEYAISDRLYNDEGENEIYHVKNVADLPNLKPRVHERLADATTTTPEVFAKLAESNKPDVLHNLGQNPAFPPELLPKLLDNKACDADMLHILAADERATPDMLRKIFERPNGTPTLWRLLRNKSTPSDVLTKILARNGAYLPDVLANPNCPTDLLRKHMDSEDYAFYIARNAKAPTEILLKLASGKDSDAWFELALNKDMPEEILTELVTKHPKDSDLVEEVIANPKCTVRLALNILKNSKGDVLKAALYGLALWKNSPPELEQAVITYSKGPDDLMELGENTRNLSTLAALIAAARAMGTKPSVRDDVCSVLNNCMTNPVISAELQMKALDLLVQVDRLDDIQAVEKLSTQSLSHLYVLATTEASKDTMYQLISNIADCQHTAPSLLETITDIATGKGYGKNRYSEFSIVRSLAGNDSITASAAEKVYAKAVAFGDTQGFDYEIVASLVRNKQTPMVTLQAIKDSKIFSLNTHRSGKELAVRLNARLAGTYTFD